MTVIALVEELRTKGVRLTVDGGLVAGDAPKGALTDALRQAIRQHKPALLTLLEAFEERAAIIEYDGHMPQEEAERLAWACLQGAGTHGLPE